MYLFILFAQLIEILIRQLNEIPKVSDLSDKIERDLNIFNLSQELQTFI